VGYRAAPSQDHPVTELGDALQGVCLDAGSIPATSTNYVIGKDLVVMKMKINPARCPQNHRCPAMRICPRDAISQKDNYSLPVIDDERCIVCGKCIRFCPMGAFEKYEGE